MWWYMEAENRFRWGHEGGVPMMEWVRLSAEETKEISLLFSLTQRSNVSSQQNGDGLQAKKQVLTKN